MEDAYVLTLKNRKFSEFYLCYCGYAKCEPLHSFGPAVRPNYLIHLILDGKGVYQIGDTKYELSKGQGFLIEPEVQTFYQANHPPRRLVPAMGIPWCLSMGRIMEVQ